MKTSVCDVGYIILRRVAIVYLNLELGALGLPFRTEKAPFGKNLSQRCEMCYKKRINSIRYGYTEIK